MALYPSYPLSAASSEEIVSIFLERFDFVWGPVACDDGSYRLKLLNRSSHVVFGKVCRLPLKKILFPSNHPVWWHDGHAYHRISTPQTIAVIGLPLCELQGAWYLDQVFAEEAEYLERRAKIVLVGSPCEPSDGCQCHDGLPITGDYFINDKRVWVLRDNTTPIPDLRMSPKDVPENTPLPWPKPQSDPPTKLSKTQFVDTKDNPAWDKEAERCFSCGACSAVCPTCYCFDMCDELSLSGEIHRNRVWDNCFFSEHGQVAGGHDFRAGRTARLRLRYEHKKLGFGPLQGVDSCTGCGRCRNACPVDIDLDDMTDALMENTCNGP